MKEQEIHLIEVPYHIGYFDEGMALGPTKIVDSGIVPSLREAGKNISRIRTIRPAKPKDDQSAILAVNQAVKNRVAAAIDAKAFPLVLSGGCSASLGVLAALETTTTGIVWFDAHGDYNTPETTPSGYFGGMPLAVANGLGYPEQWKGLTDQPPLPGSHTVLIGPRDLDRGEIDNLKYSRVTVIPGESFSNHTATPHIEKALQILASKVDGIYLHLDIDILDPTLAPGVTYRSPGGLTIEQLTDILSLIGGSLPVHAAALTAFNPARDTEALTLACAGKLIQTMVDTLVH